MNRYSRYDEDAYRLPEGMTRVGYDADEQKYMFRDRSGNEWASRSGEAYGKLERIGWDGGRLLKTSPTFSSGKAPATDFSEIIGTDDDKASTGEPTKKKRRLNPFLLLVQQSPILTMRSKMKARRDSNASASTMRSPTSTISTVDSERSPASPN